MEYTEFFVRRQRLDSMLSQVRWSPARAVAEAFEEDGDDAPGGNGPTPWTIIQVDEQGNIVENNANKQKVQKILDLINTISH